MHGGRKLNCEHTKDIWTQCSQNLILYISWFFCTTTVKHFLLAVTVTLPVIFELSTSALPEKIDFLSIEMGQNCRTASFPRWGKPGGGVFLCGEISHWFRFNGLLPTGFPTGKQCVRISLNFLWISLGFPYWETQVYWQCRLSYAYSWIHGIACLLDGRLPSAHFIKPSLSLTNNKLTTVQKMTEIKHGNTNSSVGLYSLKGSSWLYSGQ